MRTLELAKSNRGEQICLLWLDGRFVVTKPGASGNPKNDSEAEELFLQLLAKSNEGGFNLSANRGPTYAPVVMAKKPASKGVGKAALERAMHRLIDAGKIRNETFGPLQSQGIAWSSWRPSSPQGLDYEPHPNAWACAPKAHY